MYVCMYCMYVYMYVMAYLSFGFLRLWKVDGVQAHSKTAYMNVCMYVCMYIYMYGNSRSVSVNQQGN